MPQAPGFWGRDGGALLPALLSPLEALTARLTARRVARPGWRAPVPVICCGNVTVGGAGKTTVALDLGRRLRERGVAAHFLLRGYGGRASGARRVVPGDDATGVGDEALLLAAAAPTWIGADRAAGARAAIADGAEMLVLDDGLQNPTLVKDLSLLVVDGGFGFGNGRLLPAGPLRESVVSGAARCAAAVLIGEDEAGAAAALPPNLPILHARLVPGPEAASLTGQPVLAFAGIARPAKFFATLAEIGATILERRPFPDHHAYSGRELDSLLTRARELGAIPVTTMKDAVRLPPAIRAGIRTLGITLAWSEESHLDLLLHGLARAPPQP